jgi:hypothetical protein
MAERSETIILGILAHFSHFRHFILAVTDEKYKAKSTKPDR